MTAILKYVIIANAIVALAVSGSLLPKVDASSCRTAPHPAIQVCLPPPSPPSCHNSPCDIRKYWGGTINGIYANLNMTSMGNIGGVHSIFKINGSITGGDRGCGGFNQCTINGTFNSITGKINFLNNIRNTEKRVLVGLQNFTGQESKTNDFDETNYYMAGTGYNAKGGGNETNFKWQFGLGCDPGIC